MSRVLRRSKPTLKVDFSPINHNGSRFTFRPLRLWGPDAEVYKDGEYYGMVGTNEDGTFCIGWNGCFGTKYATMTAALDDWFIRFHAPPAQS